MVDIIKSEDSLVCSIEPNTEEILQKSNYLLEKVGSLEELTNRSGVYFIFKHSNTCPISGVSYGRVEKSLHEGFFGDVPVYMVVVQEERELSNKIAEFFNIKHESPQLLKVENGEVIEASSHYEILKS